MKQRSVARDLGLVVVLGGIGLVVIVGYTTYRIWTQGQLDQQRRSDAIVVMGAAQYDGRPSPVYAARLDHAVALYLAGVAPVFIVTGGKADGDRTTEAASGRAYAMARGVPSDAILTEDQSRTTQESIHSVSALLRKRGLGNAVFVSDRPHMLRVLRMAHDQGIVAWSSPTSTSPIENDPVGRMDATIHELGALARYFLAGADE